jgi:hypothetical protein
MEIPIFTRSGEKLEPFKLMAKIIGKNGVFLKEIKQNCHDAFR